ncbi:Cubilin [Apis cerana cerana]|uniref:Cubilin n=1 Tax=Apis cerana cerana TaxID=94128 RepID=A0A2A3EQ77_APICC|nr:Cubilin [Apis cerana cerana]
MYRYYIIVLLLYSVVTCINIDSWNPIKRFRHFWRTINNHENESLPFNFQKNKLQSLNVQNIIPNHSDREKRLFPLFTLIKFNNNACVGLNGENGTCIAATECSQRSGISSGLCANGYGICCIVTVSCGDITNSNNTNFVNPNYPSTFDGTTSCQLTLVKSHPTVCQFRLDFMHFNIRGPETTNHQCIYDQFIVSGGNPIPTICGNNAENHLYIDAGLGQTNPVTLTFITSGQSFARSWKIQISQIRCNTIYRAEEGCLQYFTGISGQIKSFNYDPITGLQLSNQDYSICIRMERNFCGIQYMICPVDDKEAMSNNGTPMIQTMYSNAFTLTGNTQATQIASMTGTICQTDWLTIPCAFNTGRLPTNMMTCIDRICGGTFNAENQNLNASSIISTVKPFRLIFHTDSVEAPNDVGNKGFCLNYIQQPCTTKLR